MSTSKKTTHKINADDVGEWAKKKKRFSTTEVAEHFGVSTGSARALVAILRIQKVTEPTGKALDGASTYKYIG